MKKLLFVSIFLIGFIHLFGQSKGMNVISPAGSSIVSDNIVISWTIGEDLIDFSLIEATMIPKPGSNSEVLEMKGGTLLKVYPTLTNGPITIEVRSEQPIDLRVELIDLMGKKLKSINLVDEKLQLDINSFSQGGYILNISNMNLDDQKQIRIVKI